MIRRIVFALFGLVMAVALAAMYAWNDRADLSAYDELRSPRWNGHPAVTATMLGVSTLLISDGQTHLMTDGFFTRPGLGALLGGEFSPDLERIEQGLSLTGVRNLAAVLVLHSHYDHAMDAPVVAEKTGAFLVGSESTANIGRGWGLSAPKIIVAEAGVPLAFGDFTITFIESRHLPHGLAEGTIDEPLSPPASAFDYRVGKTYIVHIRHPFGSLVVVGSAGYRPGVLEGYRADAVLLGIGGLGNMDADYRATYLSEVLGALEPSRVYPVHYDDFSRPLSEPLIAFPRLLDDVDTAMADLQRAATTDGFALQLLPFAEPVAILD